MNKPARPPRSARPRILARDEHLCVDCRHPKPLPESMLEVDHDIELTDGGTNEDDNLITRCIPHHQAKTEERRMAREAVAKGKTPPKSKAATAVLPERPRYPVRFMVAAMLLASSVNLGAWALGHMIAGLTLAVLGTLYLALLLTWGVRVAHWRRLCEAQRVYEQLCKVAGTAPAARKQRFKVKAWEGFTPTVVTIRPARAATNDDDLVTAFSTGIGRDVTAHRTRNGWVRLAARDDEPEVRDTAQEPTDDARTPVTQETSDERLRVLSRIKAAIFGLIGQGSVWVQVDEWWGDTAQPRVVQVGYDAQSTRTIREARADLPTLFTDLFAPRAQAGRWHFQFDPARDRFTARDEADPLAPVVPLPRIEDDLDLTRGPVVGATEDGGDWRVPILHSHLLVAGATGAGKGSVLWGIIRGLSAMIRDGRVRLWVIDPKGGMELGSLETLAHRFATAAGAGELLEEAAAAMETQAQALRTRGLRKLETPTSDMPLNVVIVDELAALTSLAGDTRERNAMNATMGRLLTQGRAVGFTVIGALQDPRQKNLDNRNLFPVAVALRLKERQMVDMVLGAGARAAGAVCDLIPRALPGVGYVVADGQAETARVRAAFVPDDEIARLVVTRAPVDHAHRADSEQLELPSGPAEVLAVANTEPRQVAARHVPDPDDHDGPVRAQFDGDPDPVTITRKATDDDDPTYVEFNYRYDGEDQERVGEFSDDEVVTLL